MLKALFAATTVLTLLSGIAQAEDVTTTRQSTGIGPLKFETDRTVRSDSDHMTAPDAVQIDKQKTVTRDWNGDTVSRSKTESTTVHE